MWTCPRCDRSFGGKRTHVCEAGLPIDLWLDQLTEAQRGAAEAVIAIARSIKGLVIEAVTVGVFIKRERSIVELRPRAKWLQLSFMTRATIASPRISRSAVWSGWNAYFVRLHGAGDVDREVRTWLRAALRGSTSRMSR